MFTGNTEYKRVTAFHGFTRYPIQTEITCKQGKQEILYHFDIQWIQSKHDNIDSPIKM